MRQVNLLPDSVKQVETIRALWNSAVVLLGTTLFVMLLLHFGLEARVKYLEEIASRPSYIRETAESSSLKQQALKIKKQMQSQIKEDLLAAKLFTHHMSSHNLLKNIGDVTSGKVWLDGMSINSEGGVFQIQGRSSNMRFVSEFMLELRKLPYFKNVELTSMGKGQSEAEVLFKILCHLKQ